MVQNPDLDQLVLIEFFSAAVAILLDALDGLQDVENALPVFPHNGTASRKTRSLIRAFKPRSVTTSTGRLSNSRRSSRSPPRSSKLRPLLMSTRKSTSLRSSA